MNLNLKRNVPMMVLLVFILLFLVLALGDLPIISYIA